MALACERAFLAVLDGSCRTPIGGHATLEGDILQFRGLVGAAGRQRSAETSAAGQRAEAVKIGADAGVRCEPRAGADFFK